MPQLKEQLSLRQGTRWIFCLALWLSTCSALWAEVAVQTASASTQIRQSGDLIEATEPRGIGGLTVLRPASGWRSLKIRLRRSEDLGLEWAEGLTIVTDDVQGRGWFKETPVIRWTGEHRSLVEPWFSQDAAPSFPANEFRILRTGSGIQLEFDRNLLSQTKTLRLNWVDYYRL